MPKESKGSSSFVLWGITIVISFVLVAFILSAGNSKPGASGPGGKAAKKVVYTRDELRTMVMGKTPDEVIAIIGKPSKTNDNLAGSKWTYEQISGDTTTSKVDPFAHIWFKDGKATSVVY